MTVPETMCWCAHPAGEHVAIGNIPTVNPTIALAKLTMPLDQMVCGIRYRIDRLVVVCICIEFSAGQERFQ